MAALPLARSTATALPTSAPEDSAATSQEFDAVSAAVVADEQGSVIGIEEEDLARAAYTQAVALYDSCVEYAMATQRDRGPKPSHMATGQGL